MSKRERPSADDHPWNSALVTGASGGIGEAFARQLAAGGTDLVLVARRTDRLEALAAELRTAHGIVTEVLSADLTVRADVERITARLSETARPIDTLVNNAGIGFNGSFADIDLESHHRVVALNVDAPVALTHAVLPGMIRHGRGWVLNISSLGGLAPGPMFAVYSASKAFITSFSDSLHEEVRRDGVVVTVICPGAVATDFGTNAGSSADDLPSILLQTPEAVARTSLAASMRGRSVKVTGTLNQLSAGATKVLPRPVNRWLASQVVKRITPP